MLVLAMGESVCAVGSFSQLMLYPLWEGDVCMLVRAVGGWGGGVQGDGFPYYTLSDEGMFVCWSELWGRGWEEGCKGTFFIYPLWWGDACMLV